MTRSKLMVFAALISFAAQGIAAQAAPFSAAEAQKSIQAQYDKRDASLSHFDLEGYLSVYNNNYLKMGNAKPSKPDQQRLALIARMQRADKVSRQEMVQSVALTPDGATVIVKSVTHLYGRDAKTKKPFASVMREVDRAFWVSTKAGWRMKQERKVDASALPTAPVAAATE